MSAHLTLAQAREVVDYLADLGVTEAYTSPLFRAGEQSSHGYDVTDHSRIDPQLGTEDDFRGFAMALSGRGLGIVMDVVPNHMGIDDAHNLWWQDVLENGMASPHAQHFDIDWYPPKAALRGKVLVPFLGDQYGKVLENRELCLKYDEQRFQVAYYQRRFPLDPRSWNQILRHALTLLDPALTADQPERMELESIITGLENLPRQTECEAERVQERYREKEVARRRLAALYEASSAVRQAVERAIEEFNGRPGDAASFDRLQALLAAQAYRLCYWRVASDEINYRRFFDINSLAAIRVEDPEVFEAAHALIFRLVQHGWVTGLRIDHPDGLYDPERYFQLLQDRYRDVVGAAPAQRGGIYVVAEKILAHDEALPPQWPVAGTTGYDFLNLLNGLFVDPAGAQRLAQEYANFTGVHKPFADVLYESKRTILATAMSSELFVLAGQLDAISEQHRWSRDFTRSALHGALGEVIACFPVYRTYIRPQSMEPDDEDRRRILLAIRTAKRRNPTTSPTYFDFIGSVLLLQDPEGLSEQARQQRRHFVLKFQQVTGPVMAKGLEDTSFYRYYPLASVNEVGGEPTVTSTALDQFHRRSQQRATQWPFAMLSTATHDTKRGEDTRARLNVLSEIPAEWIEAVHRWHGMNRAHRVDIDGLDVPDRNEEYLLYQTLVGTWPRQGLTPESRDGYEDRVVAYMDKALKEAKLHTSWNNPNEPYDMAVRGFVRTLLDPATSGAFLADLERFARGVADAGTVNSLAQTLLKICSPGVPDFYQGTELWDFSLVDPDNRRKVDFDQRRAWLAELREAVAEDPSALVERLWRCWPDARMKLFLIHRALGFRKANDLLLSGTYLPVAVEGPRAENTCAFARNNGRQWALAVAPRLCLEAWRAAGDDPRGFANWWKGTTLRLPADAPTAWRHVITGEEGTIGAETPRGVALDLAALLARFPVALLSAGVD